jgi:hypothetical protein
MRIGKIILEKTMSKEQLLTQIENLIQSYGFTLEEIIDELDNATV